MSRPAFAALLLLACFSPLRAAERPVSRPGVLHLSHATAMEMALAKNFSIEFQRFEPQIARERVRAAAGEFDPQFEAQWEHRDFTRDSAFRNSIRLAADGSSHTDDFSIGLAGKTAWGLRYDLGISSDDVSGDRDLAAIGLSSSSARVLLTQPLLRGFGTDVNLRTVRIARNNSVASEWGLRQRIIDILTRVDSVYNDLHAAQQAVKAAERSRDLAARLLADNEKRVQIGVKSPLDVTEARAEAAAREENVILTRRTVKDNENILKQLVTNDVEAMLGIQVEIEPPPSPAFRPNVVDGIREGLELRPDYRQAILELENLNITLAFQRNQVLPRFDLTGSLRALGFDNDIGSSLGRTVRRDESEWTIGAIMSIPIGNRAARGTAAAAKYEVAQQLVRLQELEQQIVVEVDNASGQVITSRERIASTDEARKLAQESLDAGEERLKAGVATTFEILELQNKLADAEAREIRARSDYNKAVAEYYRKTGTSLRVYQVILR